MLESLALTPFTFAIIVYLSAAYRAEQSFRRAVERALIRNRECARAYVTGYVAGFALGKRGGAEAAMRREAQKPPAGEICNPVNVAIYGRDEAAIISRPDIFHIEQETPLSPMMVHMTSRKHPLACRPCEALRKINHTLRLDRWIEAQRPGCEERNWRRAQ